MVDVSIHNILVISGGFYLIQVVASILFLFNSEGSGIQFFGTKSRFLLYLLIPFFPVLAFLRLLIKQIIVCFHNFKLEIIDPYIYAYKELK